MLLSLARMAAYEELLASMSEKSDPVFARTEAITDQKKREGKKKRKVGRTLGKGELLSVINDDAFMEFFVLRHVIPWKIEEICLVSLL